MIARLISTAQMSRSVLLFSCVTVDIQYPSPLAGKDIHGLTSGREILPAQFAKHSETLKSSNDLSINFIGFFLSKFTILVPDLFESIVYDL